MATKTKPKKNSKRCTTHRDGPTNDERAEAALEAVQAFVDYNGDSWGNEETRTWVQDLLCNLHHLAARENFTMDFQSAKEMFETEQREDP